MIVFLLFLKIMTSVFLAFRAILLAFRQEESSFKSLLRVLLILPTEFCLFKIHVSSAEWNREENLIALCRSLIYKTKTRGPRTDPWGTPSPTFCRSEWKSLIVTNWFLLGRYEENQLLAVSFTVSYCPISQEVKTIRRLLI